MTAPPGPFPEAATRAAPCWPLRRTILCAALIVIAVESALLLIHGDVLRGKLLDPDCYMHLQRALRLMTGDLQPEGIDPRINAPFGFAIHWTALFDGLLVAMAWPLTLLGLPPREALYLGGAGLSPLLLIAALGLLAAGLRRRLEGPAFLLLVVLFFTQPQLFAAFLIGRTDHHSLVLGLMLVQLAWLYALSEGRARHGGWAVPLALATGMAAGLQLCTTIEALPIILMVSLALAAGWLWLARDLLRPLLLYWVGALAAVTVWLACTRGAAALTPYYDRVSIVHVAVLLSGVVGLLIIRFLSARLPRWAALAAGGIAALILVAMSYPRFFLGPWPDIDPAVAYWHRQIGELQPLLPDSPENLAAFLTQFAPALFALPLMARGLRHGDAGERLAMLVSLCGLVIFGALSLAQMRWAAEVQAVMLLPWTLTVRHILRSDIALRLGGRRLLLRTPIVMAALLLQVVPPMIVPRPVPWAANPDCDWTAAARGLAALPRQDGVVMTELWSGPEILWRTGFSVVGGPYEIAPALADTQRFEQGGDAARRAVLARRGISHVLSCGPTRNAEALGLRPVPFPVPGFRLYRTAFAP